MKNFKKKGSVFLLIALIIQIFPALANKDYSVNKEGIGIYSIKAAGSNNLYVGIKDGRPSLIEGQKLAGLWRKTNLENGYFFLDNKQMPETNSRLRATSYLGVNLTTQGIEGRNDDVRWKLISLGNETFLIEHKSSRRLLSYTGDSIFLTSDHTLRQAIQWQIKLKTLDLEAIQSPRIMMGDDQAALRDPAVIKHNGIYYMYYSYVLTEEDEKLYWYVAMSKSEDLVSWSEPKILTEKDQNKNFSSPGNVFRFNGEWVMSLQTYVIPNYSRKESIRYGNEDSRVWIMRSKDLENWGEPEKLYVRGPGVEPEGMIDPFIIEDKDEKGKWWCFFKPRHGGTGYSYSYDLKNWTFFGFTEKSGENVCVWIENDNYYMMHSPKDGMGIFQSGNLKEWKVFTEPDVLGQRDWPWASKRVTAGYVFDLRNDPTVGKYVMFFHGQGPPPQSTEIINSGTDLGIAWSDDLKTWNWPGN